MKFNRDWILVALTAALAACDKRDSSDPFSELATLPFVHDNGYRGNYLFPETFGSGVALFDVDGDGDLDLYAVQGGALGQDASDATQTGQVNELFLNRGDGTFESSTASSGDAADSGFGMGVSVADVNGDGRNDMFVTNVGRDVLLLGTPDETRRFEAATPDALQAPTELEAWTTASGMADFDRDGHLDLVVVSYVEWSPTLDPRCGTPDVVDYCDVNIFNGLPDRVFRGDGTGNFDDVSEAWNFGRTPARGLGLALVDLDENGFADAYVANDTDPNRLYTNAAGRGFEDASRRSGTSSSADGRFEAGMGVTLADVNGNGLPDLVVTNFSSESNNLYANLGGGRFRESSKRSGLAAASVRTLAFGATFQDFDGDGFEDLFTACGHVLRHVEERTTTFAWRQSDQLLMGCPDARFEQLDPGRILSTPRVGRGLAAGDLDGDLAPDLVVCNAGEPLSIVRNRMPQAGASFLRVELRDTREHVSNRKCIGARVSAELDDGRALHRWVRSGTGYLSQDDTRPVFGVPGGSAIERLRVTWPDGLESTHSVEPGENRLTIEHP